MSGSLNKFPAVLFAACSFGFCLALIGLIVWEGNPANTLHQSALSWAFATVMVILAGYGFSAVIDIWKPKT